MQRRDFIKAASLGAAALGGTQLQGCGDANAATTDMTIQNARIVTMDDSLGDFSRGDITISQGKILAVGRNLTPIGDVIDGTNFIAIPGTVNCLDHMWTSVFKGLVGDNAVVAYTPAKVALGPYTTPDDAYAATYFSSLAFLNAGITTVSNQNHNAKSEAHVEQGIKAMADAGIRGYMNYGYYDGQPNTQATDWVAVRSIRDKITAGLGNGLVSLAFFPRGSSALGAALFNSEVQNALSLGLPLSPETASSADLALLDALGAIGPKLHYLVGTSVPNAADLALAASKGASVQAEPFTFFNTGAPNALAAVAAAQNSGVNLGLSTDNLTGASTPSILDQARSLTITMHGVGADGFTYKHKTSMKAATINGARALNMQDKIGTLTPGKLADVVLIRTNTLTMTNTEDLNPYRLLMGAQINDVDTVIVGGAVVKRNGTMLNVDINHVHELLSASLARLRKAGNWPTVPF